MKITAILFLLIVSINAQELEELNEQISIVRYEGWYYIQINEKPFYLLHK